MATTTAFARPAGADAPDIDPARVGDFVTLLSRRAREQPAKLALVYLADGESESSRVTFLELHARAQALAGQLAARGCTPGERVLLLSEAGAEFIAAFLGCLYARVVAVPSHVPRPGQGLERVGRIAQNCSAAAVLASARALGVLREGRRDAPALAGLEPLDIDEALRRAGPERPPIPADPDAIAFIQYTSGSTGEPRGVAVTHRNLLENERAIYRAFMHSHDSVVVGWLPLYHDMGLIGNLLQPLYGGFTTVLMPPVAAIQKPMRVIRAVARYRATSCGGPNFFFDLCVRKFARHELEAGGVPDLSCWTRAYNGAEPVRAQTLEQFARLYEPYGFRRSALYPCYGLAEATLFVTGAQRNGEPKRLTLSRAALERNEVAGARAGEEAVTLVGCGEPPAGTRVAIVDPDRCAPCAADRVGEIWISGPGVAQGYWGEPELTARAFRARLAGDGADYLRTGDLGFIHQGELMVTGRLKDLIIMQGRNHYPQDIERTVQSSHPAFKAGGGAAFTIGCAELERLCVVHEVEREALRRGREAEAAAAAREAVARMHGLRLAEIVLVPPGAVSRTSSGKIRRRACRQAYLDGSLARSRRPGTARQQATAEA